MNSPRFFFPPVIFFCIILYGGFASQSRGADQPNFVFVLVDDLRWDELACTGHPFSQTPNIDRIAHEGTRFRNAFCTTPLCSPSRANLLTGLETHNHGILDNINRSEQSHQLVTFPRVLQEKAGYHTAYIGKWHMGNDETARPGFDHWVSMKGQGTSFDPELNENGTQINHTGHTTDVLNQKAVEYLQSDHGEKPFCLYLAHKALHPELMQRDDGSITDPKAAKFLPAKRHAEMYRADAIRWRFNVRNSLKGKPALQRPIEGLEPLGRATGTKEGTIKDRLRMLAAVDEGVGMLFDALEKSEKLKQTIIIFTSDHGYWYGEHGLSVERRLAYEEGLRIPLLARGPEFGLGAGKIRDEMVLTTDLAPTVLELAGLKADALPKMDGRSLVNLLKGKTPDTWRHSFLIEYNTDTVFPRVHKMGFRAIRTKRWKLIRYLELDGMDEFYDLRTDPYEMRNRIDDPTHAEMVTKLNRQLDVLIEK